MDERDSARARSEAVHHKAGHQTGEDRATTRRDRALQRYLTGVYYAALSHRHGRPDEDRKSSGTP